jgi:hypothetical protein
MEHGGKGEWNQSRDIQIYAACNAMLDPEGKCV